MSALASIRSRIEAAARAADRDPRSITLIAVSKTQSADAVESLYREGQRDFGENYVQELVEKAGELERRGCSEIRWHFIGHLQTNKARQLVSVKGLSAVHSVDSLKLARELAKRCSSARLPIFLQVNIDAEESKGGLAPSDVRAVAEQVAALPELKLAGLMSIPNPELPGAPAAAFARMRELEKACRPWSAGMLSMGMSGDFEMAIAQGATHVRVGTALFGERN